MYAVGYDQVIARLRPLRKRSTLVRCAAIIAWVGVTAIGCIMLASVAESIWYFPPVVKTLVWYMILGAPIAAAVIGVARVLAHPLDNLAAAHLVERAHPELADRLISAVQLGHLGVDERSGQSGDLIEALLASVDHTLSGLDCTRAVPTRNAVRAVRSCAASLAIFLLLIVLLPEVIAGGLIRIADHTHPSYRMNRDAIYLVSRPVTVIRGESYRVPGVFAGSSQTPLTLRLRWEGESTWISRPVAVDPRNGSFTAVVERPRTAFTYTLAAQRTETAPVAVRVIERPEIAAITTTLEFPRAAGLGRVVRSDNDGSVRALRGTQVTLQLRATAPLARLDLVWADSTRITGIVSGDSAIVRFAVERDDAYHLALIDTAGIENSAPITYRVSALSDEIPAIALLSPAADVLLPGSMHLPLVYRALDDFGLSSISLEFTVPREERPRTISIDRGALGVLRDGGYDWDLSGYNLLPEDTVSFRLAALDNDTVDGPKRGVSETRVVRLPSMTELMSGVNEEQTADLNRLREFSERTSSQDEELAKIDRNLKSGGELGWADKNALGEARRNLDTMRREMADVAGRVDSLAARLSEEDVGALETIDRLEKIADLMSSLADGSMKQAIEQLARAAAATDPRIAKQALDQYAVTTDELQQKLDRLIAMLEQANTLQRFELAKGLLETMAMKQAEVSQRVAAAPGDTSIAATERALAKEMEGLQAELDSAAVDLRKAFGVNTSRMRAVLGANDVPAAMSGAADHLAKGQTGEAERRLAESNRMLGTLLNESDYLASTLQAANGAELRKRLFTAMADLLVVSERQEELIGTVFSGDTDDLARRQLALEGSLDRSALSLTLLGDVVADLASVMDQMTVEPRMAMDQTVAALAAQNRTAADQAGREALQSLNRSVYLLSTLLAQSPSGQSGGQSLPGDLLQQLQQIADGQLSLQQQMGGDQMMRLAAEQQKLAEMLSKLGEKIASDKRLQELLGKLSEEMEDTADLMEKNEPREVVEGRQLDIYRRLLDARRSRREKDESEERRSFTSRTNAARGADRLAEDRGEHEQDLNRRIRETLDSDLAPAYKELARRYFEALIRDTSSGGDR